MNRLFLLAALLASSLALAQTNDNCITFTQNLTGTAPTVNLADGAPLSEATGYTVVVSAPSGQTITGGGLTCHYKGVVFAGTGVARTHRWFPCPTVLNFTPQTGARDASSGDYPASTGVGSVKYVPAGITLSGAGTTVDVTICVRRRA